MSFLYLREPESGYPHMYMDYTNAMHLTLSVSERSFLHFHFDIYRHILIPGFVILVKFVVLLVFVGLTIITDF